MFKSKKFLSFLLAVALIFNIFAVAAVAAPGDPSAVDAKVELVAGRYDSTTLMFTPLSIGETIAQNEIIAVRIVPTSNYLVGASNYVVMFDKTLFTVMGTNNAAFTVNSDGVSKPTPKPTDHVLLNEDTMEYYTTPEYHGNHYYDFACTGFAGTTTIPDSSWPASFSSGERYDVYKAIKVGTQSSSSNLIGGYPEVLPGDWLFQFKLKATANIVVGTNARIWTDARWFRSNTNAGVDGYIPKCLNGDLASNAKNTYDFNFNFNNANILLPLTEPTVKSTITFNTDGGSTISSLRGDVGAPVIPPQSPTKTGYNFAGWDPLIPSIYPPNDITVKALWSIKQSTVTFNSNGGTAVDAVTGDYLTAVPVPASPTREGYNFLGWQPTIPSTFPENNVTVLAQWAIKQITVTFDSNGGSVVASKTGNFGAHLQPPATPVKSGYEFVAWDPALPSTYPANSFTATAQWVKRITINFNTGEGSTIQPLIGNEGTVLTPPSDPTRTGYRFAGWSPALPAVFPNEDSSVNAVWEVLQTTIYFDSQGGTPISSLTGNYGTVVTPPADPTKPGFVFNGWGPEVPATFPPENKTVVAQWTAIDYSVDITYQGNIINGSLKIVVPWTKMYSSMKIQLGYVTNIQNPAKVEYISSAFNVTIDQNGNITNKGFLVRSSNITVNVYDIDNNIVATKTVNVLFYKTILEVVMAKVQSFIQTIMALFKK